MTFTPTDTTDYTSATATATINVAQATPTISGLTASRFIAYGTPSIDVAGTLSSLTAIPVGQEVTVTINGVATPTTVVKAGGSFTATISTATLLASATPYVITYDYAGDPNFQSASDSTTTLTVIDLGFEQPALGTGAFVKNLTGSSWTFSEFTGISGNNSSFTLDNPPRTPGGPGRHPRGNRLVQPKCRRLGSRVVQAHLQSRPARQQPGVPARL